MSTQELIARLREYLDLERRDQKSKRDKIYALLKKLKKRQRTLEEKLVKASNPKKRKQLKRDLKVLSVQRKKGGKLCRAIRCK